MKIRDCVPETMVPSNSVKCGVEVIDAAGGNVGSLLRALERLGVDYRRVNDQSLPTGNRPVILPGVGAFGAVMTKLQDAKLDRRIKGLIDYQVPFLGICVGLQVLFESSEEAPDCPGLGIFKGQVRKFTTGKVPQIGWNSIESAKAEWPAGFAYFVNSYFADPLEPDIVLYRSQYFQPFCAAIQSGSVSAFQFHPEKSGAFGMSLLERWLSDAN